VPYFSFTSAHGSPCTNNLTGYTCTPLTLADVEFFGDVDLPADTAVVTSRYRATHDYQLDAQLQVPAASAGTALKRLNSAYGKCRSDVTSPRSTAGLSKVCIMANDDGADADGQLSSRLFTVVTGLAKGRQPDGLADRPLPLSSLRPAAARFDLQQVLARKPAGCARRSGRSAPRDRRSGAAADTTAVPVQQVFGGIGHAGGIGGDEHRVRAPGRGQQRQRDRMSRVADVQVGPGLLDAVPWVLGGLAAYSTRSSWRAVIGKRSATTSVPQCRQAIAAVRSSVYLDREYGSSRSAGSCSSSGK
jgi:hypothetical protein